MAPNGTKVQSSTQSNILWTAGLVEDIFLVIHDNQLFQMLCVYPMGLKKVRAKGQVFTPRQGCGTPTSIIKYNISCILMVRIP